MNIDTGGEVIKALKRIQTGELQVVLTVVECYSNPLMLALAMSIRGELASRMGWSGQPEFALPFLGPCELRVGVEEALSASECVDGEMAHLFTAIAHALAAEAEINERIVRDGPVN